MKTLVTITTILVLGLGISGQVNLIPESSKFSADARVEFTKDPIPTPYSTGTTNGIPYLFFFENGRGEIEGLKGNGVNLNIDSRDGKNWEIRCNRPTADKQRHCGVLKGELTAIKVVLQDGTPLYWVTTIITSERGFDPTFLSIDNGPEHLVSEIKAQLNGILIEEMKNGKKVTVRSSGKTKGDDLARTYDLHGFKEAWALCEWMVKQIDL